MGFIVIRGFIGCIGFRGFRVWKGGRGANLHTLCRAALNIPSRGNIWGHGSFKTPADLSTGTDIRGLGFRA